jgi:ribonuclease PH
VRDDRADDELRLVDIQRGFTDMTPGSVLFSTGRTRVLCTVSFDEEVPRWMRSSGEGWVTAEYAMLPGSGSQRVSRRSISGGRTKEIQRLIGRSLRAAVDLKAMPELTARIDCDVIQADGGTRTAAITGAWIALADAFDQRIAAGAMSKSPLRGSLAAVSVGLLDGRALLDLDYEEDVSVDVDCNIVMTGAGEIVEVQGTAEGRPFTRAQLDSMLDIGATGIDRLLELQTVSRLPA